MNNKFYERDLVIGICNINGFIQKVIDNNIDGSLFDKPVLGWVTDKSIEYFLKYKKIPTKKIFFKLLEKDEYIKDVDAKKYLRVIKSLYKKKPDNPEFSLNEIKSFSQKKNLIKYLENTAEKIEGNQNIEEVTEYLASRLYELQSYKQKEWEYVDWLDNYNERQEERKEQRNNPEKYKSFRFGLKLLDKKIPRGVLPGDFASIAAKTGRGKSIFTVHCGLQGVFQGFNVTHITTENALGQTTGRYDSRVTGIPYEQIQTYDYDGNREAALKQADKTFDMLKESLKSKIKIVKCIPNKTNILTIMDILDNLETKEKHKTELLIIDSPELMNPLSKFDNYRIQKAAVYWEIKSLLLERRIIGIGTSQLTRGSDDTMPTAEDMSEAYDKARLLDLLMVLIRTTKHFLTDEALLWIVKARDFANDGQPILLHTDFSCMFMDVI